MKKKENNSNISKILGENIKKIRKLENISQEKLAEKIGKTPHFISLVERGASGISVSTIVDICNALNTDTNSIFDGTVDTPNITSFVGKCFNNFEEKDKEMVSYLIRYIINSKS